LKLGPALTLSQNPIFEMASSVKIYKEKVIKHHPTVLIKRGKLDGPDIEKS
jgi:hypothetical protein